MRRNTDMQRIEEQGVQPPLGRWLEHVQSRNGLLHVSLDVDFLDPELAPGAGTPVPGGANYREAQLVMEMLAKDPHQRISSWNALDRFRAIRG